MSHCTYPRSINFSQAIKIVQNAAAGLQLQTESIATADALNRVLAEAVSSMIDVPNVNCSRMDGYAISHQFYKENPKQWLNLSQAIYAGESVADIDYHLFATPVMTGAVLPPGTDTVVLKEHAVVDSGRLMFEHQSLAKGQHIRKAGSDLKKGQMILKANQAISACDIGLLSSIGIATVEVYRKPQVALMMTGDELVEPGTALAEGQIYDSNSLLLKSLLSQVGCDVEVHKTLSDQKDQVSNRLKTLLDKTYDLVVSVGGVSMGDKDWLPQVLSEEGEILFHKVHIRPGFPMLFGKLKDSLFFGLPGNPVSAFSTLFQFVYPSILCLNRMNRISPVTWRAELLQDVAKTHLKREFVRGRYNITATGHIEVMVCGGQQSSRIKSLSEANCMIVLNESQQDIKRGSLISIHPFSQLNSLHEFQ